LDSPGAVVKRFEQREHATDSQGVVEYLRALLLTNSISEYLPDDRSGKASTLPTLVLCFAIILIMSMSK
jgi:ATP-dependent metalloprotease